MDFKNPNGKGKFSPAQIEWLSKMKENGYLLLVSNDYDRIIKYINEYCQDIRFKCDYCCQEFKTPETKAKHHRCFHNMTG